MNSYAERLASFTSWPHVCPSASTVARAGFHREYDPTFPSPDLTVCSLCGLDPCDWYSDGSPFDFHATRSPECPFVRATQQKKKNRNQKTRQQHKRRYLQAVQQATASTQPMTKQEEELQQANAENVTEKPSDGKAPQHQEHGSPLHNSPSNRHSASGERHYNLACYLCVPQPYHIDMVHHWNDVTRGGSTASITAN
ncbi:hypothetical protein HO173_000733 [Letharia columbiana]|uniref:Uncharacterized protein n=1 Tax=Letharia columbiana TaxID=112416 RepID=A0A8H6G5Q0_9LECA|nr:uncharacterized protein HO173_000733 [Letharia columbiana]KAF6240941.1 hypothetical protein HO173_000733 [Letharia columbiana]